MIKIALQKNLKYIMINIYITIIIIYIQINIAQITIFIMILYINHDNKIYRYNYVYRDNSPR